MSDRASMEQSAAGTGVGKPRRLLVVMPSWVGDSVMATAALGLIRDALPGAFIGALVRPGIDELLAGSRFFDEVHVERASGMMGPKRAAAKVRPRNYDTALLLTNSFSTALITRLAFIPRRIGYDRDGRGLLLTDRIKAERREGGGYACVSAVEYYVRIARAMLGDASGSTSGGKLELGVSAAQERGASDLLARAGVDNSRALVIVNPGGNNAAKRWPAERFARVAADAVRSFNVRVLVNGSPGESELVDQVVSGAMNELNADAGGRDARGAVVSLVKHGVTLGALKGVVRRASLMLTNDTGPRHIAAAMGVPTVTLFGPTDPRWTTLPPSGAPMVELVADPTLPKEQVADDFPDRCRIERIEESAVRGAVHGILGKLPAI